MPPRIEPTEGAQGRSSWQPGPPGATLLLGPLGRAAASVPQGAAAAASCCTDIGVPGDAGEYCMSSSESSALLSILLSS